MVFYALLILVPVLIFYLISSKTVFKKYPSILGFGDVMFDRGVRNIIEKRKRDPFEYIKKDLNLINNFDIVTVNLEGPIVEMDRAQCQQKIYNFQFSKDTTDRLKSIGVNMVNIANNHSYDCLKTGFLATKKYLEEAQIEYMGDRDLDKSYVIKNIDEKKIAFVGIDELTGPYPVSRYYPIVKRLKSENDYVVVNIHWGTEYELQENSLQKSIAHNLIDNGVDVIFGHHPHVLEPMEVYKGAVVFYSLGNFVFDQDFGDTTIGLGAGVEFQDNKKVFNIFPYNIKKFAPDFMKGEEKDVFCQKYLKGLNQKDCRFIVQT